MQTQGMNMRTLSLGIAAVALITIAGVVSPLDDESTKMANTAATATDPMMTPADTAVDRMTKPASAGKETTLIAALMDLRSAIDLYRGEHDNTLPGTISSTSSWANFTVHMTTTTNVQGGAGTEFGVYLSGGVPKNPVNGLSTGTVGAIPPEPDGSTGWYYDPSTGEIRANVAGIGTQTGLFYFDM